MNDRDLLVESSQRRGEDGGRVSLHDYRVRLLFGEHRLHPAQRAGGDIGQSLPRAVDIQVEFGLYPEDLVDLVEHGPVLCGHGDERREERRLIERLDERCDLDRLGPRAVDDHDAAPGGGQGGRARLSALRKWHL